MNVKKQNKDRITRKRLRALGNGDQITVQCIDGYDLVSQKNTAYGLGRLEKCKFACKSEGLTLTVTRYDAN